MFFSYYAMPTLLCIHHIHYIISHHYSSIGILQYLSITCTQNNYSTTSYKQRKLKHFLKYLQNNQDDSPLYVFHSNFDEDRVAKRLLCKYSTDNRLVSATARSLIVVVVVVVVVVCTYLLYLFPLPTHTLPIFSNI